MQYLFCDGVTILNGDQARMARAALNMSVRDLAKAARVSPNTVTRLEAGLPVNNSTALAIQQALEGAGAVFRENGDGPGVHLKKRDA
jgi:transcriptional regulator with XRE-family HTH domain